MKAVEIISQEMIPWSMSSRKAVSVKASISPKLQWNMQNISKVNTQKLVSYSASNFLHQWMKATAVITPSCVKIRQPSPIYTTQLEMHYPTQIMIQTDKTCPDCGDTRCRYCHLEPFMAVLFNSAFTLTAFSSIVVHSEQYSNIRGWILSPSRDFAPTVKYLHFEWEPTIYSDGQQSSLWSWSSYYRK